MPTPSTWTKLLPPSKKCRVRNRNSPRIIARSIATAGLDGVIIATPPHWHALPFIAACQKGLAIYCEKPLAYDIREGRAMANAAKKAGNLVAIGFQRRTSDAFQQVREYVRAGNAGRIVQADVQIHYTAALLDNKPQDPPAGLDWELWCGPAPKLPYSPQVGHKSWRLEEAYGNGHLVDWGIHLMDATRMMLDLGTPTSVEAAGGIYEYKGRITTPDTLTATSNSSPVPSSGAIGFGERRSIRPRPITASPSLAKSRQSSSVTIAGW